MLWRFLGSLALPGVTHTQRDGIHHRRQPSHRLWSWKNLDAVDSSTDRVNRDVRLKDLLARPLNTVCRNPVTVGGNTYVFLRVHMIDFDVQFRVRHPVAVGRFSQIVAND